MTYWGCMPPPFSIVKTSPLSTHAGPHADRAALCHSMAAQDLDRAGVEAQRSHPATMALTWVHVRRGTFRRPCRCHDSIDPLGLIGSAMP